MQDAGAYGLYQAAVPLDDWIVAEQIIVLMVSADEQRGKGPGLQPVQPLLLRIAAIPLGILTVLDGVSDLYTALRSRKKKHTEEEKSTYIETDFRDKTDEE